LHAKERRGEEEKKRGKTGGGKKGHGEPLISFRFYPCSSLREKYWSNSFAG
jgi:hypothetical protein